MAAATGRFYAMNMREGQDVHSQQKHALGQLGLDNRGNRWTYVQFSGAIGVGQWAADEVVTLATADIVNANSRTTNHYFDVTETAFKDDDKFGDERVVEGAYGVVHAGGSAGDNFIIDSLELLPDNVTGHMRIHVMIIDTATGLPDKDKNWSANFNGTTNIQLSYVGRVRSAADSDAGEIGFARGVAQKAIATGDAGKFGWLRQSGIALVNVTGTDNSGRLNLAINGGIASAAGGTLGRVLTPARAGLVLADIDIVNSASRLTFPPQRAVGAAGHSGPTGRLV